MRRMLIGVASLVLGAAFVPTAWATTPTPFNASPPTSPNNCLVTNDASNTFFSLMINEAPVNGTQYTSDANGSFISCLLPHAVVLGPTRFFDPPTIDNGELSDVLNLVSPSPGVYDANLYSKDEYNLGVLNAGTTSIQEFNSGFGLNSWTIPPTGSNCSMPSNGTLSNADNENCFGILSNEAVVPEPGTLVLLGTGLLGLVGVGRRRRIQ